MNLLHAAGKVAALLAIGGAAAYGGFSQRGEGGPVIAARQRSCCGGVDTSSVRLR